VLAEWRDPKCRQSVRESRSAQAYKKALEVASRNLKKLADAGVRIAMGTDGRFQGYFEHLELERIVEAGLTPRQALLAATGEAARCMGLDGQSGPCGPAPGPISSCGPAIPSKTSGTRARSNPSG
jgi:hypothetical protein